MGYPAEKPVPTLAEFLAWEETQPDKHEFVNGEIFAMVGARRIHANVTLNVASLLKSHLRGTPCRAFVTDVKLQVATNMFYPDVFVTCDPGDLQADRIMQHPRVIIEILSDSTAAYDRGEKFSVYRQVDSLQEYALIDPERLTIEVFRRMPEGDWLLAASEAGRGLILKTLDFTAAPDLVFEDVAETP
ncbi:MAG: Uma2 family endonuclease [Rhodocyclaceae bacterium]|nr:Uma2 family endonuclease [Rhodocyclaceae bacterium]